ncbi:MAG: hypothetical protein ABIF85_06485 [Nanoarchaeota archaeon]
MKKALSRHFVLFGVFFLVIALGSALLYDLFRFSAAQGTSSRSADAISDANLALHGIKQSFEKTALFFGLMNTAKELGVHGGVSAAVITAATDGDPGNDPVPKMDITDGVLNFAVSRCKTVGTSESTIRKRMPYLSYIDANFKLGTDAKTYTVVSAAEYVETMKDVVRGDYQLNIMFNVIMLKEESVDVQICQNANCNGVTTITTSGTTILPIGNSIVQNSVEDITLIFTGSAADVAHIRVMAVSIYDKDVVNNLNAALNASIESYRQKLKLQRFEIEPLNAFFVPAGKGVYETLNNGEGFLRGSAYGPDKISSLSADANLKNWNLVEEDAQIRYWRMYGVAKFFVDNYEAWVKPRWYNQLNTLVDHQIPSNTLGCNSGRLSYANGCPSDPTPQYTAVDFRIVLNSGLDIIAGDISNQFDNVGADIKLKLSIAPDFQICPINSQPSADENEWCSGQNLEYYRYKSGLAVNTGKCSSTSGCTGGCDTSNTCYMHYDSRYVLKNVPINVTIIDEKYNVFDSVEKKWVPYQFTFFVEIDIVDDNACDDFGHVCSTQSGGAFGPQTVPPIEVPSPLLYTCENTAGQTCEAGAGCPVGKIVASGTCDAGELCCKDAPAGLTCADNGGTCYFLGACLEGENEVPKITISDCQEITKICCKVGLPPPPTCDLVFEFMGGCPPGMEACSDGCVDMPLLSKVCCIAA